MVELLTSSLSIRDCVQIADADVCAGAVGTQAPILAHDLRSISLASHAAKNFCGTIFGMCPLQPVLPYSVTFSPQSNAVKQRPKWHSKGRKPFKVVHLSDVHIDRAYQQGTSTICSKVICCHDWNGLGHTGLNVSKPAGKVSLDVGSGTVCGVAQH